MKIQNYATPNIEVVEIEIENAVLQNSTLEDMTEGGSMGDYTKIIIKQ